MKIYSSSKRKKNSKTKILANIGSKHSVSDVDRIKSKIKWRRKEGKKKHENVSQYMSSSFSL